MGAVLETLITWFLYFCVAGLIIAAVIVFLGFAVFAFFVSCFCVCMSYQWCSLQRRWYRINRGRCPGCNKEIEGDLAHFVCHNSTCKESNPVVIESVIGKCSFCGGKLEESRFREKAKGSDKILEWDLLTCSKCLHHVQIPFLTKDELCSHCGGKIEKSTERKWRNTTYFYNVFTCIDCARKDKVLSHKVGSMKGYSGYDPDYRPGGI